MVSRTTLSHPLRNRMLAALPEEERRYILLHADFVKLDERRQLYSPAAPVKFGYFIESGMISELIRMRSGRAADVSPAGIEGFVGLPLLTNNGRSAHECLVQLPSTVWRVPGPELLRAFEECKHFRRLILRYIHARFLQATQCSACNLLHSMPERLGRWLLLASDHAGTSVLNITQEFLSEMLGANRSTITIQLGEFQKSGLISYRRGVVQIENRELLDDVACECNEVIAAVMDRVFE